MGQNNRQRRADKARKRSRRAAGSPPRGVGADRANGSPDWNDESGRAPFQPQPFEPQPCDCLACRVADDPTTAWPETGRVLVSTIAILWSQGWQPNELVRQVRRSTPREAAWLLTVAILADDRGRPIGSKHPRWQSQIDHLVPQIADASVGASWVSGWLGEVGSTADAVGVMDATMEELLTLGPLHRLIPPPGETATDVGPGSDDFDDPVLAKVRALLAQAESTTFPAEAETFTAKAQALMSRHAIDEALVRHAAGDNGRPSTIRLPIDDPYASEKALLLHVVAEAGRCRSISIASYALATLTGQATDVRRVELLFTSLLLQAQSALNHEATTGAVGSHRRSRSFRSAFLAGYAQRIGHRLSGERRAAEADAGADSLPVLARQSKAIDDEVERLFGGQLRFGGRKSRDLAGWDAGSEAADRARLRESAVRSGAARGPGRALPEPA